MTQQAVRDSPPKEARVAGPSVKRVPEQEGAFLALGGKALVFRYHGGAVRCWVETSTGGEKKLILGEVRADPRTDSGVLVWQEHEGDATEMEAKGTFSAPKLWDLGIRAKTHAEAGGITWHVSRLSNRKISYPAPPPEAVKDAPKKMPGGSGIRPSSGTDGEIDREELKAGEPVCLHCRSSTARFRKDDGKEVTLTLRLMCELLAPHTKDFGTR